MELVSFKNKQNTSAYYPDNTSFEYLSLIGNMIIIKAVSPQLLTFNLNKFKSEAIFQRSISLSSQSHITQINPIDAHNIIIVFQSKELYQVNIDNGTETALSFCLSSPIDYDLITFRETMLINNSQEPILYGFLSKSHKLYLITQVKSSLRKRFALSWVKSFDEPITHIIYHHFHIKQILYCFICIGLSYQCVYLHFIIENSKSINAIKSILNKDWHVFFKGQSIATTYVLSRINEDSFHALTSDNQLYSASVNTEYTPIMTQESIIRITKRPLTFTSSLKSILHSDSSIYFISNETVEEINPQKNENAIHHCYANDMFVMGASSNQGEGKNYCLFLTKRSLLAMSSHSIRASSFGISNYTLGMKRETTIDEEAAIQSQSSSKSIEPSKTQLQCSNCLKKAEFRCDKCKLYYSCSSPSIHVEEWAYHTLHCPKITKNSTQGDDNEEDSLSFNSEEESESQLQQKRPESPVNILRVKSKYSSALSPKKKTDDVDHKELDAFFNSNYASQRKDIISHLKSNKLPQALSILNAVLSDNIQQIITKRKENQLISFDLIDIRITFTIEDILISFQQYFEYFTNLLLLIHIYAKLQAKDKLWRTINHLNREMQAYNYDNIIELIIEYYNDETTRSFNGSTIAKCEEILLGVLKYSIALAKYSYCLGEFAYYEKFLLDFLEKIQRISRHDYYLLNNMYLLLGNLYLKFNIVKKAQMLYEAIIEKNINLIGLDSTMYQVVLCANYNLGVISFIIGRYHQAKLRLEIAIKIKKEFLKELNDIQLVKMYLTLAEIEVEFNNHPNAYHYLQKASETKEFIIDIDEEFNREFSIKERLLKEFIIQNANEDSALSNEAKNNFMLKHFGTFNNKSNILQYKLIQDVIKETPPTIQKGVAVNQLEQFFLFMTQLTKTQITRLNEDQPKDIESNKRLPIVFSLEFKTSLSQVQSLAFSELQLISLTRVNILKNYLGKIKINNLNYNALYNSPQENSLILIQNGYLSKSILQTWEVSPQLKKEFPLPQMRLGLVKELSKQSDESNKGERMRKAAKNKEQQVLSNIFNEKDMIDYDKLRIGFKNYCRENAPEKELFVTEELILLIGQEMKREELIKICTNQELIPLLIDLVMVKKGEKGTKKMKNPRRSIDNIMDLKLSND